ncbi:histidine phosphatase family protein [uncultured Jannaschia sp.]|uniref:SixA phosphatase family protein n=1 Tax=uncultured Jannaschia sp. TaxID=293347 RepID=UPI002606D377|nr:histidine phosphatase family protein [uncultured Jannaschia sp.]
MKLILLRHAKSDWSDPAKDGRDRPLNERGRAAAEKIGSWLKSRHYLPDLVLCSDALRTRQTLSSLDLPETATEFRADLYEAEAATILEIATGQNAECVLVVGHNPGIGTAAADACATPPSHPDFLRYPTGACTVIDLADGLPGRCLDFTTPRAP